MRTVSWCAVLAASLLLAGRSRAAEAANAAPPRPLISHFRDRAKPRTQPAYVDVYVGAQSQGPGSTVASVSNAGLQSVIQAVDFAPDGGCFSCWAGDLLDNGMWGQLGFGACSGPPSFQTFYQVWPVGGDAGTFPGVGYIANYASSVVSEGLHTYTMVPWSGNTWAYLVDGNTFGLFDMGSAHATSDSPSGQGNTVTALCEEGGNLGTAKPIPQVSIPVAVSLLNDGSWAGGTSAYLFNSLEVSGGVGALQDSAVPVNAVVVGGTTPYVASGPVLWNGTSHPATVGVGQTTDDPPLVNIRLPVAGTTVSGTVNIAADIVMPSGAADIASVTFSTYGWNDYVTTQWTVGGPPYAFAWDTTQVANEPIQVEVELRDVLGNWTEMDIFVVVDNPTTASPSFTLVTAPSLFLNQAGTASADVYVAPAGGFAGSVSFGTVRSLPSGVSAAMSPASSATATTLTLSASATAKTRAPARVDLGGAATTGDADAGLQLAVSAALGTGGSGVVVDLSPSYDLEGITTDQIALASSSTGLDTAGFTYSANQLSGARVLSGVQFDFGPADALDAVSGTGAAIALPAGSFDALWLLGTGVNGAQTDQSLAVQYSDGTQAAVTQGFSDWLYPGASDAGETEAVAMPYRNRGDGSQEPSETNLYAYRVALDATKSVQALMLPNDGDVVILAATLIAPASAASTDSGTSSSAGAVGTTGAGSSAASTSSSGAMAGNTTSSATSSTAGSATAAASSGSGASTGTSGTTSAAATGTTGASHASAATGTTTSSSVTAGTSTGSSEAGCSCSTQSRGDAFPLALLAAVLTGLRRKRQRATGAKP